MSGVDRSSEADRRIEAARWLAIAREDVRVVNACLALSEPAVGSAAYHCQQAAEKLMKGLLVIAEGRFPRTHDLEALGALIEPHYADLIGVTARLGPRATWNTAFRYPGDASFTEPPPDSNDLNAVLADIAILVDRLRRVVGTDGLP